MRGAGTQRLSELRLLGMLPCQADTSLSVKTQFLCLETEFDVNCCLKSFYFCDKWLRRPCTNTYIADMFILPLLSPGEISIVFHPLLRAIQKQRLLGIT